VEATNQKIEQLVKQGAGRLIARATDSRSLDVEALAPRVAAAVEKYLLRDDPNTAAAEINKFIDEMQADDLCLIIACERDDEGAWNDLVARFTTTVRSAARSASANEDAAEDLAQSIWAALYGLRVRDDGQRALLYKLDQSIRRLRQRDAACPEIDPLIATYHNLLRMWAEI